MDLAAREMQHVRMALDEMSAGRGYGAHDGLTEEMPQAAQAVELAALELQHVDMALDQERDGREDVAHMDCKPIDAPLQDGHVEGTAVVATELAIQTLSEGSAVVGNIVKPQRGRPPLSAQEKAARAELRSYSKKLRPEQRMRTQTPDASTRQRIVNTIMQRASDREANVEGESATDFWLKGDAAFGLHSAMLKRMSTPSERAKLERFLALQDTSRSAAGGKRYWTIREQGHGLPLGSGRQQKQ